MYYGATVQCLELKDRPEGQHIVPGFRGSTLNGKTSPHGSAMSSDPSVLEVGGDPLIVEQID